MWGLQRTRDPEQEHSSVTSTQEQRLAGSGAFSPFQLNAVPVVSRPRPRSGGFCADLNLGVQGERPATMLRAASEVEVVSTAAEVAPPPPHSVLATTSGGAGNPNGSGNSSGNMSSARKARRCWSPELHRRFVSALQQLGGSHSMCSISCSFLVTVISSSPCLLICTAHVRSNM